MKKEEVEKHLNVKNTPQQRKISAKQVLRGLTGGKSLDREAVYGQLNRK